MDSLTKARENLNEVTTIIEIVTLVGFIISVIHPEVNYMSTVPMVP